MGDGASASRGLNRILERAGIDPAGEAGLRFHRYLSLLAKWNSRVNLTASTSWGSLCPFFEEALWASGLYSRGPVRHLDIGSGAGFPALPMRILRPDMQLCLVESSGKKAAFLETAVAELGLENVEVSNRPFERHLQEHPAGGWAVFSWKAIRLRRRDWEPLLKGAAAEARFWLFHAAALPVEDSERFDTAAALERREPCPAQSGWFLSIYRKKTE